MIHKCKHCGKQNDSHKYVGIKHPAMCFNCNFWQRYADRKDDPDVVRIKNRHYVIAPDSAGGFRGFGGARFVVHFMDGRVVETHNLWSQGTIDEAWQKLLPDNTTQIEGMHFEA